MRKLQKKKTQVIARVLRKYFMITGCTKPFEKRNDIKARNCINIVYHLIKDRD